MNPAESRPPTLLDLVSLCRELNSRQARYIVIGGMAMIQHGFVRATEDIDLLVAVDRENEEKVIESLSTLPDQAAQEIQPGEIDQYEVIRIADEVVVDLMKAACGVKFEQARDRIQWVEIEGTRIPFASLELMQELKQGLRPKDKMDLDFIRALLEKKLRK